MIFITVLLPVLMATLLLTITSMFGLNLILIWSWVLLLISSLLLIILSLIPSGRNSIRRWLENGSLYRVGRLIVGIVAAFGLLTYITVFTLGVFLEDASFLPEEFLSENVIRDFTRVTFVLLASASGLSFAALRGLAVFNEDDYTERRGKYDFNSLKRDLFESGIHLFFSAILVAISGILKFGNDLMTDPLSDNFRSTSFIFGNLGNMFAFIVFVGFIFQAFKGLVKLFMCLNMLAEELNLQIG